VTEKSFRILSFILLVLKAGLRLQGTPVSYHPILIIATQITPVPHLCEEFGCDLSPIF
jgi:hypothetical protein